MRTVALPGLTGRGLAERIQRMAEHASNSWRDWARMLAPMIVAPVLAAAATVAVLDSRLGNLEKSFEKMEGTLNGVRAEVGAIVTTNARYDERISALGREIERLTDENGALRERIHNAETNIRVMQRADR